MKKARIRTIWETWSYDVWGNARDGYEVNDRYLINREYELDLDVQVANQGTPREFLYAHPTDKQIREALDIKPRVRIETEGDDQSIYVSASKDGYPLGEMLLVSPESLSPIKV